jgi:adenosine/AMP kinase
MALLHIAFQEGFVDDIIIVRVNDKEVFRKENVTTRLQIGYADSFEVTINEGRVSIEILLPLKNLSKTIVLHIATVAYVGASIHDGRIDYRISDKPFGYL